MIIKPRVGEALDRQIGSELAAANQYTAIAIYFDDAGLPDLASFFYRQSDEERGHALKFVHFMLEAGARPTIPAVPATKGDFVDAAEAVQYALDQELQVTDQINNLVSLAVAESDHTTNNFLQWFVMEQVEEVASMTQLLQTIRHAGTNLLWVEDFVRRFNPEEAAPPELGE